MYPGMTQVVATNPAARKAPMRFPQFSVDDHVNILVYLQGNLLASLLLLTEDKNLPPDSTNIEIMDALQARASKIRLNSTDPPVIAYRILKQPKYGVLKINENDAQTIPNSCTWIRSGGGYRCMCPLCRFCLAGTFTVHVH